MRDSTSVFVNPDYDVDSRIYFSDISISKEPIMQQYQALIAQGRFDDAKTLIQDEDYYGAWLINLFGNRLINIFAYVSTLEKPVLGLYQSTEPTNISAGTVWIDSTDLLEDYTFPGSDTYPADDLFPCEGENI